MTGLALLPHDALLDELGPPPPGVELALLDAGSTVPPPGAEGAGFLVVPGELGPRLPDLLPRLPELRVVQALNAGVEWLLPLAPAEVTVCNASGVHDGPVADWVVTVILTMAKQLPAWQSVQDEGRWARTTREAITGTPPLIASERRPVQVGDVADLDGYRVLVVGHGSIGRAVAARLAPFGARVTGIARHARADAEPPGALPRLLPGADAVVLLAPHTPETDRLVDAAFLAAMQPGALLVNAARGALVDHAALEVALRAGRLRAALDVTDPEPLPSGHSLWTAPNLLLTPHVAGYSPVWRRRAYRFVATQLARWAAGEPLANVRSSY